MKNVQSNTNLKYLINKFNLCTETVAVLHALDIFDNEELSKKVYDLMLKDQFTLKDEDEEDIL